MLAWVGTLFLSSIWSVNLHRSLLGLSQALCYLGVFLLGRWLAREEEAKRLLLAGVGAGALISACIGLESYVANVVLLRNPEWRIFGPFINPNAFAGYLLVASPALVYLGLRERSETLRRCAWVALAFVAAALFLTASRGGILAAFLAYLILGVRLLRRSARFSRRPWLPYALAAGAALACLVLVFAMPPIRERLLSAAAESNSASFRAYTWLGSVRMAAARPVTGWGVGSFEPVFGAYAVAGYTRAAHNDYLQTFAEAGLLGLVAYLVVLVGFLWGGLKAPKLSAADATLQLACWTAVLGFSLHSLVDYDLLILATGAAVWLCIGLATTVSSPTVLPEKSVLRPLPRFSAAALLAVSLLFCGYSATAAYAESQRKAGQDELAKGALPSAVADLRQAVRFAPLNSEAHRALALALEVESLTYGRKAELEDARSQALAAADRDRMRAANWLALGRVEMRLGMQDSAEKRFQRATRLTPNDPHAWLVLAEFYLQCAANASTPESRRHWELSALPPLRRIQQIENEPAGRVMAVPDLVDLTFSRATLYLARGALLEGRSPEALAAAARVLDEIARYRSSRSIQALSAVGEEPYQGVEKLEAVALLLRAQAEMRLGDRESSDADVRAAYVAWPQAERAFESFMKGGILP
jgi:O-antigen ligase/Flp pilus assembly protein TadD